MKPIIEVGNYEIIDSGTIIIDNKKDLSFKFNELKFSFKFSNSQMTLKLKVKITKKQYSKMKMIKSIYHFH